MTAAEPTLHKRIRAEISQRILSGDWSPGQRIPFEHELMADYGCSRMTVNRALTPLADSGMIVRRRRAGTFVAHPPIHSAVLDIPDLEAEITARGQAYDYEWLSQTVRTATTSESADLKLAEPGPVLAFRGLHRASGKPFALEERLIDLATVPAAAEANFQQIPPGKWLLSEIPWTQAEHTIRAINPTSAIANLLKIPTATACLSLARRTLRGNDPVTWVRMTFPGDSYEMIARFTPGSA